MLAADFFELSKLWSLNFTDMPLSEEDFRRQFDEFKLSPAECLVARIPSGIAGFIIATNKRIPFIGTKHLPGCLAAVVVSEKYRRQGIGSQLVQSAERQLMNSKVEKIRLGYPTYLRGTILSLIGLDIQWLGAARFFETFGYAPRGALDSMILSLENWQMPGEMTRKLEADRKAGITFSALSPLEEEAFMAFLEREFSSTWSWHDQFAGLRHNHVFHAEQVLVAKEHGETVGFAGPLQIAPNGDTCGIGLGLAASLRGRGLGMSLVYNIINFVKTNGGRKVTLFGAVDKISYYGKAGFVPGSIWLIMEKKMPGGQSVKQDKERIIE